MIKTLTMDSLKNNWGVILWIVKKKKKIQQNKKSFNNQFRTIP